MQRHLRPILDAATVRIKSHTHQQQHHHHHHSQPVTRGFITQYTWMSVNQSDGRGVDNVVLLTYWVLHARITPRYTGLHEGRVCVPLFVAGKERMEAGGVVEGVWPCGLCGTGIVNKDI